MKSGRLTLAEIRRWPPTVDVTQAALALGVSRSSLYQAIQQDACPVAVIRVNRRLRVLTGSLVEVLDPGPRPAEGHVKPHRPARTHESGQARADGEDDLPADEAAGPAA